MNAIGCISARSLHPVHLTNPESPVSEFSQLEDVPPETQWFANIDNLHPRRGYQNDLKEFMTLASIRTPIELRLITRAHVIASRKDLEVRKLALGHSAENSPPSHPYMST
jgi:hypothetical protein